MIYGEGIRPSTSLLPAEVPNSHSTVMQHITVIQEKWVIPMLYKPRPPTYLIVATTVYKLDLVLTVVLPP